VKRLKSFFSAIKSVVSVADTENHAGRCKKIQSDKDEEQSSSPPKGLEPLHGLETLGEFLSRGQSFGLVEDIISPDKAGNMSTESISPDCDRMANLADDVDPSLMELFDAATNPPPAQLCK
jgi:hypothetical protein